jgi:DnaJ-class molecular chaperone
MAECEQCNGAGEIEVDYHMPHNINRDVGFIDTRIEQCDWCDGTGEAEDDQP